MHTIMIMFIIQLNDYRPLFQSYVIEMKHP